MFFTNVIPTIAMLLAFGTAFFALYLKSGMTKILLFFASALLCFTSSLSAFALNISGYEIQNFLAIIPIVFGIVSIYEYNREKRERK